MVTMLIITSVLIVVQINAITRVKRMVMDKLLKKLMVLGETNVLRKKTVEFFYSRLQGD